MASSSTKRQTDVHAILNTSEDFPTWEHEFFLKVDTHDLTDHVKERARLLPVPTRPDIRRKKYTKNAAAQQTIQSRQTIEVDDESDGENDIQESEQGT
jgi:hypothetical protein